jgi:hypothetical protein
VITMGGGYSRPMTGEHLKVCMESYDKGILFMCCKVRNHSPFLSCVCLNLMQHQLKHMGMSIGQQLCAMVP